MHINSCDREISGTLVSLFACECAANANHLCLRSWMVETRASIGCREHASLEHDVMRRGYSWISSHVKTISTQESLSLRCSVLDAVETPVEVVDRIGSDDLPSLASVASPWAIPPLMSTESNPIPRPISFPPSPSPSPQDLPDRALISRTWAPWRSHRITFSHHAQKPEHSW